MVLEILNFIGQNGGTGGQKWHACLGNGPAYTVYMRCISIRDYFPFYRSEKEIKISVSFSETDSMVS